VKFSGEINSKKDHKITNGESISVRYVQQPVQNIHDNENYAQTNPKEVHHIKHQVMKYFLPFYCFLSYKV